MNKDRKKILEEAKPIINNCYFLYCSRKNEKIDEIDISYPNLKFRVKRHSDSFVTVIKRKYITRFENYYDENAKKILDCFDNFRKEK